MNNVEQENTNKFLRDLFVHMGKTLKYITNNDKLYFKAKDIADYLGYTSLKPLKKYIKDEDRLILQSDNNSLYINESCLYRIALECDREGAKKIKSFIMDEDKMNLLGVIQNMFNIEDILNILG